MTRLLLDTHTFLYALGDPSKLSRKVQRLLADPSVERWVSAVSLWEIAIKVQIRKLDLPLDPNFYTIHLRSLKAAVLPVNLSHSLAMFSLPLHHRDPFDRLLIAQARSESLTLATRDAAIAQYDVPILW